MQLTIVCTVKSHGTSHRMISVALLRVVTVTKADYFQPLTEICQTFNISVDTVSIVNHKFVLKDAFSSASALNTKRAWLKSCV